MTTRITVHPASHPVRVTHTEGAATRTHTVSPGDAPYEFHIHSNHEANISEVGDVVRAEGPDGIGSINTGNLLK